MPRVLLLDSFPLSCLGKSTPPSLTETAGTELSLSKLSLTDQCRQWVIDCLAAGHRVCVPAIVYYETLRELERLGAAAQIGRLKAFCFAEPERFLVLETAHLEAAARLWAQARQGGMPTAGAQALDGDVLLAAQAQSYMAAQGITEADYVIATTNVGHLARYVPAALWSEIIPGS